MAKIAFKDWAQTKKEEEKLRKKREMILRRQGIYDSKLMKMQKTRRINSARGGGF